MISLNSLRSPLRILSEDDVLKSEFSGLKTVAANRDKNIDLMYITYIFCHEGPNDNGDYFFRDELEKAHKTAINKPINHEHGEPIVGVITDAVLHKPSEDAEDPRWYIECAGVIWKFLYPSYAEAIKRRALTGGLRNSMEAWFTDFVYVLGDEDNIVTREEGKFLEEYVGYAYDGIPVYRGLKNITFGGSGIVERPADRDAIFLSVAHLNETPDDDRKEDHSSPDGHISTLASVLSEVIKRLAFQENTNRGRCENEVSATDVQDREVDGMKGKDDVSLEEVKETVATEEEVAEVEGENEVTETEVEDTTDVEEEVETPADDEADVEGDEDEVVDEATASEEAEEDVVDEDTEEEGAEEDEVHDTQTTDADALRMENELLRERLLALERELLRQEQERLVQARLNDLMNSGLFFSESTLEKLKAWIGDQDEEKFLEFREILMEARYSGVYASKNEQEDEDATDVEEPAEEEVNEEVEGTTASKEEEGAKPSATPSFNLESSKGSVSDKMQSLAASFFGARKISTKL